jgi:hypothetical protein
MGKLAWAVISMLATRVAHADAPRCIAQDDTVQDSTVDTGVTICTVKSGCWRTELATSTTAWTRIGDTPPLPPSPPDAADAPDAPDAPSSAPPPLPAGPMIKICRTAKTCRMVRTVFDPKREDSTTAITSDGKLIAVWDENLPRVYSTRTGKSVTTIRTDRWKTEMSPTTGVDHARMLATARAGHDVFIVMRPDTPVSDGARIYDPYTGKYIGTIGAPRPVDHMREIAVEPPVQWDGDLYLFQEFQNDNRFFLQNVRTGKLVKVIELYGTDDQKRAHTMTADYGTPAKTADGKSMVVVPEEIGLWPIDVIEIKTGKLAKLRPPVCP